MPQFAARGWTKVGDAEFTYLGEHLPSPTGGDEDDEAAANLIEEIKERLTNQEAGVKDTTSKSVDDFTLVEMLAPSATQSKELANAGFNIKSDAALVLIARAAGLLNAGFYHGRPSGWLLAGRVRSYLCVNSGIRTLLASGAPAACAPVCWLLTGAFF